MSVMVTKRLEYFSFLVPVFPGCPGRGHTMGVCLSCSQQVNKEQCIGQEYIWAPSGEYN